MAVAGAPARARAGAPLAAAVGHLVAAVTVTVAARVVTAGAVAAGVGAEGGTATPTVMAVMNTAVVAPTAAAVAAVAMAVAAVVAVVTVVAVVAMGGRTRVGSGVHCYVATRNAGVTATATVAAAAVRVAAGAGLALGMHHRLAGLALGMHHRLAVARGGRPAVVTAPCHRMSRWRCLHTGTTTAAWTCRRVVVVVGVVRVVGVAAWVVTGRARWVLVPEATTRTAARCTGSHTMRPLHQRTHCQAHPAPTPELPAAVPPTMDMVPPLLAPPPPPASTVHHTHSVARGMLPVPALAPQAAAGLALVLVLVLAPAVVVAGMASGRVVPRSPPLLRHPTHSGRKLNPWRRLCLCALVATQLLTAAAAAVWGAAVARCRRLEAPKCRQTALRPVCRRRRVVAVVVVAVVVQAPAMRCRRRPPPTTGMRRSTHHPAPRHRPLPPPLPQMVLALPTLTLPLPPPPSRLP